ncbi:MAG: GntR family transcriptional regulator [Candidatus Eremiobacteraeota bacterium]|nr:GntR family transcriptional regulator [Candidatus Eremiobacteraeota bacterium]
MMPLERRSTPSLIAEAIREQIQAGDLPGGSALNQNELAERFGVSRIPVREALRQLESDGTIRYVPNQGAVVSAYTAAEIRERFEIRGELEPLALRLAIANHTPQALRALERELTAMRDESDPARWGKHHTAFHRLLYEGAGRPRLLAIIESLYISLARAMTPDLALAEMRVHDAEHRAVLDAVSRGDAEAATRALRDHLGGTLERTLAAGGAAG